MRIIRDVLYLVFGTPFTSAEVLDECVDQVETYAKTLAPDAETRRYFV